MYIIDFQWSGYFQQAEFFCEMCGVGMLFISLNNTYNSKKCINGCNHLWWSTMFT